MILEKQALHDKRFGLRNNLIQKRDTAEALKNKLEEALTESIRPIPELREALKKISEHVQELNHILGQTSLSVASNNPSFTKFIKSIGTISQLDEVANFRSQLEMLSANDQWTFEEISNAYDLISIASNRIYKESIKNESNNEKDFRGESSSLNVFRVCAAENRKCTLIIDGHNVLYKLKTFFGSYYENSIPGEKARDQLKMRVLEIAKKYHNINFDLWFDSSEENITTLTSNFRIHFSGGKGQNRADEKILAYLKFLQNSNQIKMFVTADRDIIEKGRHFNAFDMSPFELMNLIKF